MYGIVCFSIMNLETIKIAKTIQKPPEERTRPELEEILPYLAKRSELLQGLQRGELLIPPSGYCN